MMQFAWFRLFVIHLLLSSSSFGKGNNDTKDADVPQPIPSHRESQPRDARVRRRDYIGRAVDRNINSVNGDYSNSLIGQYRTENLADGKPRGQFLNADSYGGGNQLRVLSAGSRRTINLDLGRIGNPRISDADLNHFDDNNLENELNALATGFEARHDFGAPVIGRTNDLGNYHYHGLGFDDHGSNQLFRGLETVERARVDPGPFWMEWGHCNVSCGVGKQSRWRQCRGQMSQVRGLCNRVTGREEEWRRCLGMDCDQQTVKELTGGCQDQFITTLLLGMLVGIGVALGVSLMCACLYGCRKPDGSICPSFTCGCGECCSDRPTGTCCYGCDGANSCCCCQPCCQDSYSPYDMRYLHTQYPYHPSYRYGEPGRYKRPPEPLPRSSPKKRNDKEPEYIEIDLPVSRSPRKTPQKQKDKRVAKRDPEPIYNSLDEETDDQVENEYMEVLADGGVDDDTYLTPSPQAVGKKGALSRDYEFLGRPPPRPR
ncbi:uncharacterized protein [Diadema setosum]|uniref:uncharacterized protein n=1 Tax=Diadema setosum TaxID=31175 RepID=UPI003B3ACFD3